MLIFLVAVVMSASPTSQPAPADRLPGPPPGHSFRLIWHDEFDGLKLDETQWTCPPDAKRRDGWWMRSAVSLDGQGHLRMRTYKEGDRFISGCVLTQGKFEHAFGYYVARVRFHREPGHWPAFWLMGRTVGKIGDEGRDGSEIDIMEKPWLDGRVCHAVHWDGYGQEHKSASSKPSVDGLMEGWHIHSLLWTPDEYVFYVDGQETWRTRAGGVCQVPLHIMISDEVGKWAGDITKAELPDEFQVDYVRVYDLVRTTASQPSP